MFALFGRIVDEVVQLVVLGAHQPVAAVGD